MKREAPVTTKWGHFVKQTKHHCYYEVKQTRGTSFAFSSFEPHQIQSLLALEETGVTWKFSDQDQRQKPCDGACLPPLPAYVVIRFPHVFVAIRIKKFVKYMEKTIKKSITLKEAMEISEKILHG